VCGRHGTLWSRQNELTTKKRPKFGIIWIVVTIVTGGLGLILRLIWPRHKEVISVDRYLECSACSSSRRHAAAVYLALTAEVVRLGLREAGVCMTARAAQREGWDPNVIDGTAQECLDLHRRLRTVRHDGSQRSRASPSWCAQRGDP